ncbi:MAG: hypothetical protein QOJ75_160 [Chloroflexota bacterium]|jgi:hypothetical protein|nr:hypothetical protein [Chloroflexota bacterium]
MTTPPGRIGPIHLSAGLAILVAFALAACSAGASVGATSGPSAAPPVTTTNPSNEPGDGSGAPGGGLGPGGDQLVVPKPGQLDVHPISADAFTARVEGHRVVITIAYTSGIEPCSVLDSIVVERGSGSFAITLREGRGPGNQVCIMIARMMKTQVDLGELDPGTYTISDATGGAAPIQVVVG